MLIIDLMVLETVYLLFILTLRLKRKQTPMVMPLTLRLGNKHSTEPQSEVILPHVV